MELRYIFFCGTALLLATAAQAGVEGSISGTVLDSQGIAVPGAKVDLETTGGTVLREVKSSATGEYEFFPVNFGDYQVAVHSSGFEAYQSPVHVTSGGNSQVEVHLVTAGSHGQEMVLKVEAHRQHRIQSSASVSNTEISHQQIQKLPQGDQVSLPTLLANTTPGIVKGAFGQLFIRGNHAEVQYQIDGVQLPESPSNTFGEQFSPRNIDHMEVITGGIPAEYGERLSAVVNIITRTGPENPGGSAEVNYGSYNTISPELIYGGSNASGDLHYFLSANYHRTDRGIDTPQAVTDTDESQGTRETTHDSSNGNNEFAKFDWLADNDNKLSLILFNSYNYFDIPNYPSRFLPSSPLFTATDQYGNPAGSLIYTPSLTNDTDAETNSYIQAVWKHTFTEHSFLQIAPYYKYSNVKITNDPTNDLYTNPKDGTAPNAAANPASFAENRHTNNLGVKADYSLRPDDRNLVKSGLQLQASRNQGTASVQTTVGGAAVLDNDAATGYFEAGYVQDDFNITKQLILNAGLRFDAVQYQFSGVDSSYTQWQPRVGLNYLLTEDTKIHAYYGRLFQLSPVENLRATFVDTGAGSALSPYDIKPEKDNYFEVGVAQQLPYQQVLNVVGYYKLANDLLDDTQLFNTPVAQPYNYDTGYAYGLEVSLNGQIDRNWSEFVNYSYDTARGTGVGGGLFAFPAGQAPAVGYYQYLDHVQFHTVNSGVTYAKDQYYGTLQALFGSGLRTGPNNTGTLPAHFTMDLTGGYTFTGDSWLSRWKVSADLINIFNNLYPITVANGFNGSHYNAGREFFVHLTKDL